MPPIISGAPLRLRSRLAPFSIREDLSAHESSFVGEQSTAMSPPHFSQQAPQAAKPPSSAPPSPSPTSLAVRLRFSFYQQRIWCACPASTQSKLYPPLLLLPIALFGRGGSACEPWPT